MAVHVTKARAWSQWLVAGSVALATGSAAGAAPAAQSAEAERPAGTLQHVMRGVLFPNANIIFDVQTVAPDAPPPKPGAENGSTSAKFATLYGGWEKVVLAAVSLDESVDMILKAGRTCENGKPVPVASKVYRDTSLQMRAVARKILAAATEKDAGKVIELTGDLAEACAACHRPYRDIAKRDLTRRCPP